MLTCAECGGRKSVWKLRCEPISKPNAKLKSAGACDRNLRRCGTLTVVEDDSDVRTLAVVLLGNLGYQIMAAASAAAALEQLGSTTAVNILLTDVGLPGGMNGRELATEAVRRAAGIDVLYMSGYTEDAVIRQGRLDADAELRQKPFRRADLARAMRRALDSPSG